MPPTIAMRMRAVIASCSMCYLLAPVEVPAKSLSAEPTAIVDSAEQRAKQRDMAVTEWFRKYDQIRRNAEMSPSDRSQSLHLASKKPEKKNFALASRMIDKYTIALAAMKELTPTPETKELQDGYIEYFSSARHLFIRYVEAQREVPFIEPSPSSKKQLQELDRKNKKLDDELRKKFMIHKHQHSSHRGSSSLDFANRDNASDEKRA